ncbi:hypothetical protein HPP92_022329 [Vanilla planifolia]|uniref:BHLH domain-containing protein n=1 Tax=Vanilla planifolia TaxID=51239 RepID=A0A835PTA8_VANPL|nr:hypothetical protein HPP92_022329 [Vanilla planifolia]
MSRCVPSWDIEEAPPFSATQPLLHHELHSLPSATAAAAAVPTTTDFDVAELTWKDGSLSMLSLPHTRVGKPVPRYPSAPIGGGFGCGTLECIVDQATRVGGLSRPSSTSDQGGWSGGEHADALVPSAAAAVMRSPERKRARVGDFKKSHCPSPGCIAKAAKGERTSVAVETCNIKGAGGVGAEELGFSNTRTASPGSAGDQLYVSDGTPDTDNGSFGVGRQPVVDDRDSVNLSLRSKTLPQDELGERGLRSSISTKRSRVAAVHNQSERKRRDKINQKMKALQKLLPNSSKTDKASMLDEVIEYLKVLQAQIQMMNRMGTIPMMLPIAIQQQQQLQMTMMANMATQMSRMGLSLGMMDPCLLAQSGHTGPQPILYPSGFLPFSPAATGAWEASPVDWMLPAVDRCVVPGMFSTFLGCPAQQQMGSEAYSRMAALYQQMYQQTLGSNQKT